MGNVFALHMRELSAIDTDAVQVLKRDLGDKRCRTVIDGVIFEITDILCNVERATISREYDAMLNALDRLEELSARAGLVCISDISQDLRDCIRQNDITAIAAVTTRLIRVGEDSLFSLIEFTDRSII